MNWYQKYQTTKIGSWEDDRPQFDNTRPYDERMMDKDEHEAFTWDRVLQQVPWVLKKSTTHQDRNKGIDAIITGLKSGMPSTPQTVQLKIRQSGNDVLLETIKPYPPPNINNPWTGKDSKSEADLFYCVDSTGILRIFKAEKLQNAAKELSSQLLLINTNNPQIKKYRGSYGEARIVLEPSQQANYKQGKVNKMIALINHGIIKPIYTIQL